MKMLNKKILINKIEMENKTSGGIILTKPTDERYVQAKVVELDSEIKDVHKGDVILVDKYKIAEVKIEGASHFCDIQDVVAIIGE